MPTKRRRKNPPWLRGAPLIRAMRMGSFRSGLLDVGAIHLVLKLGQQLVALLGTEFTLQFFERKSDDVIMMRSRKLRIASDIEPELVHKFNILRTHARSVRSKGVFANGSVGRTHFHHQPWTRLRQPLPGVAGELGLF